jgi:hypothetical protein
MNMTTTGRSFHKNTSALPTALDALTGKRLRNLPMTAAAIQAA